MASQKRIHEIRLGKSKSAIWRNAMDNRPRFRVIIVRLYKVEGGDWESSSSFGRDERLLAGKVADVVHTWIYQQSERTEVPKAQTQELRPSSKPSSGRR